MALTSEEKSLLDELTRKSQEPDADEEFEFEIYDTKTGRGARIPFSKGKNWLFDNFGIGEASAPKSDGAEGQGEGEEPKPKSTYFNRNKAA